MLNYYKLIIMKKIIQKQQKIKLSQVSIDYFNQYQQLSKNLPQLLLESQSIPKRNSCCSKKYIQQKYHQIMREQDEEELSQVFLQKKNFGNDTELVSSHNSKIDTTREMINVINAQHALIMKLIHQQYTLTQKLRFFQTSSPENISNSSDEKKNLTHKSGYKEIQKESQSFSSNPKENEQFFSSINIIQQNPILKQKKTLIKSKPFSAENQSSEQNQFSSDGILKVFEKKKKQIESKNMIKNFSKAIFNFLKKNRVKVAAVLTHLNINEDQFLINVEKKRGQVHSIADLRALWVPEGNKFDKAFRILSNFYLKRQYLAKTFNSRIENYLLHLKYRQRLMQGLEKPKQFIALKIN